MAGLDQISVGPNNGLTAVNVIDPNNDEQPLTTSYSFTISQALPRSLLFEIAYVGNHSDFLQTSTDVNYVPFMAMINDPDGNQDAYRLRHNYQAINQTMNMLKSNYNSLQTSLARRVGSINLQANYTWSKFMGSRGITGALPNYGQDYLHGVMNQNRAHVFNLAYSIEMPSPVKSNAFAKALANGWQISGISQLQSGASVINATEANFSIPGNSKQLLGTPSINVYPTATCDPRANLSSQQYLNGACFGPAAQGAVGFAAYPYWSGPAFISNDLSVFKNFVFGEAKKLQFRFSGFNFLNHPLPSFRGSDQNLKLTFDDQGVMNNSRFGYADYKYGHRILELAVKFMF
jgi:hypothetical protein